MSLYKKYETDQVAEQEGTPVPMDPNEDGTTPIFYLARASRANKEWGAHFDRLAKDPRFVTKIRLNEMKSKDWETMAFETFVATSLKGWQNVQDREDNELPFNVANATKLLTDLPELYAKLQEYAASADTFRKQTQELSLGNSSRSSNTH